MEYLRPWSFQYSRYTNGASPPTSGSSVTEMGKDVIAVESMCGVPSLAEAAVTPVADTVSRLTSDANARGDGTSACPCGSWFLSCSASLARTPNSVVAPTESDRIDALEDDGCMACGQDKRSQAEVHPGQFEGHLVADSILRMDSVGLAEWGCPWRRFPE